jgi:hypothetical protein
VRLSKSTISIHPVQMATRDLCGEVVPVLNEASKLLASLCRTCSAINDIKYEGCERMRTLIDVMDFASHLASEMVSSLSKNKPVATLVSVNPSSTECSTTQMSSVELLSSTTSVGPQRVKKTRVKRSEPYKRPATGNSNPKAAKEPKEKKKRGRPAAKNLPALDIHSVAATDAVHSKRAHGEGEVLTPPCIKKARVSASSVKWLEIDAKIMTPVPDESGMLQQQIPQKAVNAAKETLPTQKKCQQTVNASKEDGSDHSSDSSSDESIRIDANLKEYNRIKNSSLNEIFGHKKGCEVMRSEDEDDD